MAKILQYDENERLLLQEMQILVRSNTQQIDIYVWSDYILVELRRRTKRHTHTLQTKLLRLRYEDKKLMEKRQLFLDTNRQHEMRGLKRPVTESTVFHSLSKRRAAVEIAMGFNDGIRRRRCR